MTAPTPSTSAVASPEAAAAPQPPLLPPRTPVWPRPAGPPRPAVPAAAAAAGVVAALALPGPFPGIGWLLVGAALVGLTVLAGRTVASTDTAGPEGRGRGMTVLWTGLALGLLALGTVRAAEWLFPWCVLGAALAGSVAVAGGRTVRGLLVGAVAVPCLALGALPWAARRLRGPRAVGSGLLRTFAALAVSAVLVALFASLLAGADVAFARLLTDLVPRFDVPDLTRWFTLFPLFAAGTVAAVYLRAAPPRPDPERPAQRGLRRIEWALPVGLLVALFATFVGVQVAALFGGADHVLRTTGLTYAEYARGGFWQLLQVTVLTLPVLIAAARYASVAGVADRAWLRGLLGMLAGLTLLIVCSALSRMWAYQQAYGFTVLRVQVFAVELWLGLVYLMLIAAGRRLRAGWLPRVVAVSGLAGVLALGALNPDRFIAERNIERWAATGKIDQRYLAGLSADAVPTLARLPEPIRGCVLGPIAADLDRPDGWRDWNASRAAARELTRDVARTRGCGSSP